MSKESSDFSPASVFVAHTIEIVLATEVWEFADSLQESFECVELVSCGEEVVPFLFI
jgi:hypothetical protein